MNTLFPLDYILGHREESKYESFVRRSNLFSSIESRYMPNLVFLLIAYSMEESGDTSPYDIIVDTTPLMIEGGKELRLKIKLGSRHYPLFYSIGNHPVSEASHIKLIERAYANLTKDDNDYDYD